MKMRTGGIRQEADSNRKHDPMLTIERSRELRGHKGGEA